MIILEIFFSVSPFRKLKSHIFFCKTQNKKSPILASGHLEKQKFATACKVIAYCQKAYSAIKKYRRDEGSD